MPLDRGPRAVRATMLALGVALTALLFPAITLAQPRDFESRFTTNDTGDIVIVANTLLTCPDADAECADARNGLNGTTTLNSNNGFAMRYVDEDGGGASPTFNSSRATLTVPSGATVLFAGLYWGADSTAGSTVGGVVGAAPPNAALRNQVLFETPAGGGYQAITASQLDSITGTNGDDYQGFANVTTLVQAGGGGVYTVANVQAGIGGDRQAGWALVVVLRDPTQPPRNLTVFDGLRIVQDNPTDDNIDIPVSGFQTPPTGAVNTQIGVVAYEGDRGSAGDDLRLDGNILTDANNPTGNFFNSTISNQGTLFGAKSPNYINQLGFDADIGDASDILANNATSATINLTTGGETYLPGVVTFVTELYAPEITAPKSVIDVNGGNLAPGDILEYTIVVTNTGQDAANFVITTDPIPVSTTFVPGSLQIDGVGKTDATADDTAYFDVANNRAVYHIGTGANASTGGVLAANGGSATLKLRVQVNPNTPNGTSIFNQVSTAYTGATSGTAFSTSGAASTATISQLTADLSLSKTSTPIPFVAGEAFSYTIVASNLGPDAAPGATIADTLPAALAGFTWTCTGSGGATCATPGPVTLGPAPAIATTADLPSGGSVTIVVTGTLPSSTPAGLTNTATITPPASVQDPVTANNEATDVNPGGAKADLRVSKASTPNAFVPGDTLTYTIIVSNSGPSDALGARVRDQLDAALGSFTWTCSAGTGANCQTTSGVGDIDALVDLPVGTTATFTITGVVPPSYTADATNTATIDPPADVSDPVPGNNVARSQNPPGPQADLSIIKTQTPDPYTAGSTVTYTLLVQNQGPSDVTNARVQDIPPGGVSNVTWTCAATGGAVCGIDNGVNVIDALVTLPAGTTATFTMTGTVAPGVSGVLTNTATVKEPAGVTDPVPGNNESSVPSGPAPVADLSAVKTASIDPYVPGLPLSFTIVVSNAGPSDALNARVQDLFPTALSGFAWTCAPSSGSATCDVGSGTSLIDTFVDLPTGSAVTFTVSGTVPSDTSGPLTNTVTVTPPQGVRDPDPSNSRSSVTVGYGALADLQLTKTSAPNPYVPGTPITYTIVATNAGPSAVFGGRVRDGLPAALENVTWTCSATNAVCPSPSGTGNVDALVDIAAGGTMTFTITADVPAGTQGTLVNAATIVPPPGLQDPNPNDNSGVDTNPSIPLQGPADLQITQVAPSVAPPNGLLTFRLVTKNLGSNPALNPYITGMIPPGTTFVSATPSAGGTCTVPGNPPAPDPATGYPIAGAAAVAPLKCTWPGLMQPGESHTLEFTVRVAPGTPTGQILWSCWWTWSQTEDPYHANNVVDAYLFVHDGTSPAGDLALQGATLTEGVIGAERPVRVGEAVPIRFWATNHGPAATRGQYALILDTTNTIEIVSVKVAQGWISPSGPASAVWDTGPVAPGQTVAVDLTVRLRTATSVKLFAQRISGAPGDPNATNEHAEIVLDGYGPAGSAGRWVAVGNVDGAGSGEIVTGAGQGETPQVRVFTGTGADTGARFFAYERPFLGGVQVASCDVNGDGVSEVITAPGPGRAPTVRVLNVLGGVATELIAFDAFESSFRGGTSIACADLDADGAAELVVGAGPGRAPEVHVYNVGVSSIVPRATFLAYESEFRGGVRVAAGAYAGRAGWLGAFGIATTPGPGRAADLRLWETTGAPVAAVGISGAKNGVLPTLGDANGDGELDLVIAPDDGRPELVRIFHVDTGTVLGNVPGGGAAFPGGVRIALGVLTGGPGVSELVVGNGPGGHPRVRVVFWPPAGPVQRLEILPLEIP